MPLACYRRPWSEPVPQAVETIRGIGVDFGQELSAEVVSRRHERMTYSAVLGGFMAVDEVRYSRLRTLAETTKSVLG